MLVLHQLRRYQLKCCNTPTPLGETVDIDPIDCDRKQVMWSPRRHHASVTFTVDDTPDGIDNPIQYLYIMGGRARELISYQEEKSIGGIIGPRVQDVPVEKFRFSTQREASVLKSDVWRSLDGENWELVHPGCEAPDKSVISQGNLREGKSGKKD